LDRQLLTAGASYYGHASTLVVKVRALRDGVHATAQASFNNIVIEGDNQVVIQALT